MSGALLALAGGVILVTILADTVATVLRVETRSGPITRAVALVLWHLFNRLPRPGPRGGPPAVAGLVITLVIVMVWLSLIFAGWYLIFSASEHAVVHGDTGDPAGPWARAYYTAYVISTLGIGDYVPGGPPWQVLTGLAATAGLVFASLTITYLASLTSAVAHKRHLGRTIAQIGTTPQSIVLRAWDGRSFDVLRGYLTTITPELNAIAEQHLTYPVLYFFRADQRHTAHWPSVATLDEALFILDELVDERVQLPDLTVKPTRAAIAAYLDTVPDYKKDEDAQEPPAPPLDELEDSDVPLQAPDVIEAAVRSSAKRRSQLVAVLRHQGWSWQAAVAPSGTGR